MQTKIPRGTSVFALKLVFCQQSKVPVLLDWDYIVSQGFKSAVVLTNLIHVEVKLFKEHLMCYTGGGGYSMLLSFSPSNLQWTFNMYGKCFFKASVYPAVLLVIQSPENLSPSYLPSFCALTCQVGCYKCQVTSLQQTKTKRTKMIQTTG